MIVFLLLQIITTQQQIDSLEAIHKRKPVMDTALLLHKYHLQMNDYERGIEVLTEYEKYAPREEKADILFLRAETYFYRGELVNARAEYLRLVSTYPRDDIANDALERLHMLEALRPDTVLIKKLSHALFLNFTEQTAGAIDTLKILLSTSMGVHAYYHLALIYVNLDDLPLALGALRELDETYPAHHHLGAQLLKAYVYRTLGEKQEARTILEEIIVRNPNSIYAARARKMLEKETP